MMTYQPWFYIVANMSIWIIWSVLVGYVANRLPARFFAKDTIITRLAKFETQNWFQKYLLVHKVKRYLPERGQLFGTGVSKKSLPNTDSVGLKKFLIETRRAEYVHWVVIFAWVLTLWFNPPWAVWTVAILLVFGNLPCILVQRYNRLRVLRVLSGLN